jgi:peptidoglycan/LPS O-acetylase OafA/YrhL
MCVLPASPVTVDEVSTSNEGQSPQGLGHLPFLDGIRAFAVALVLFYHAGFGVPGGYVGVDAFLVVSGFIITLGLLREKGAGSLSLRDFWARRVRRLLPVSSLVAVVVLVSGVFVLEPQRASRLPFDVLAAFLSVANVRFVLGDVGYLGGLSLPSPLLHYWSLALEEQFYLLFPPVLVLLLRFRRLLLPVLATLLAVSLAFSAMTTATSPVFAYFMLPARAWEFLAGVLLALVWSRCTSAPRVLRSVAGLVGVGVVLGAAFSYGPGTVFPGVAAFPVVLGVVAVIFAGGDAVSGRFLSLRVFRWVGERSYGIYLWHWPLLVFARAANVFGSVSGRFALLALSVVLADVSFRLLERPVRRAGFFAGSPSRSFRLAGLLLSVGVVSSLVVASVTPTLSPVVAVRPPVVSVAPTVPSTTVPVASTFPSEPPRVLLVGDSTLAPLRWFVDGSRSLEAFSDGVEFVLDAESARRLAVRAADCRSRSLGSCRSREGRYPSSAVEVLEGLASNGTRFDHVVVMAGYHSTPGDFVGEVDALLAAAERIGVSRVFFLTYRESLAFPLEGSNGSLSVFGVFNDLLRERLRSPVSPEVVVLDWNAFSSSATDLFRSDGIHTNLAGTLALGEFIARGVRASLGLPCAEEPACLVPPRPSMAGEVLARYRVVDTDEHCYEMGEGRIRECVPDKLR